MLQKSNFRELTLLRTKVSVEPGFQYLMHDRKRDNLLGVSGGGDEGKRTTHASNIQKRIIAALLVMQMARGQ